MEWIEPFVKFGLPTILLIILYRDTRALIEAGQKKCDEQTNKLGEELKQAHANTQRIMETTIREGNETRQKQVASFDALTEKLSGMHCMNRERD